MDKQKLQINLFDAGILLVALAVIFLAVYGKYAHKSPSEMGKVLVTIRVPKDDIETAARTDKQVYINSVNKPVTVTKVAVDDASLLVTVSGQGKIDGQNYYFNGQRILLNQRAEIHASYFAQGKIYSVSNEN